MMAVQKLIHLVIIFNIIAMVRMELPIESLKIRMDRTTTLTFYCETIYAELESRMMIRGRLIHSNSDSCSIPPKRKQDYEVLLISPDNQCSLIDIVVQAKIEGYSAVILYGDRSWTSYADDPEFFVRLKSSNVKMYVGVANNYDTASFQVHFSYPNSAKFQAVIDDIGMQKSYPFRKTHPILWNWICLFTAIVIAVVAYNFLRGRKKRTAHKSQLGVRKSKLKTCLICRRTMRSVKKSKKLPCNHVFHKICIEQWFRRIHKRTCPLSCKTVQEYTPSDPLIDRNVLIQRQVDEVVLNMM